MLSITSTKRWCVRLLAAFPRRSSECGAFHFTPLRWISFVLNCLTPFPPDCGINTPPRLPFSSLQFPPLQFSVFPSKKNKRERGALSTSAFSNVLTISQCWVHSGSTGRTAVDANEKSFFHANSEDRAVSGSSLVSEQSEERHHQFSDSPGSTFAVNNCSSPSSSTTFPSSLASTVQRLVSSFQNSESVRLEQEMQLSALRRQLLLIEQRLNAIDLSIEERENQLNEVLRAMGDLHVEVGGVQQIVQQLERRSELLGCVGAANREENFLKSKEEQCKILPAQELATEVVNEARPHLVSQSEQSEEKEETSSHMTHNHEETNKVPAFWKDVSQRLEKLEAAFASRATINTTTGLPSLFSSLSLEEGLCTAQQSLTQSASEPLPVQGATTRKDSVSNASSASETEISTKAAFSAPPLSSPSLEARERMRDQLMEEEIIPFRCLRTGKVCLTSKTVLVRGVPFFWGAAHIRELCEIHVGGVVSCLLSRSLSPLSSKTGAVNSDSANNTLPSSSALTSDSPTRVERVFEVVFRHPLQAVKALTTLHSIPLAAHSKRKSSFFSQKSESIFLSLEPVVSEKHRQMVYHLRSGGSGGPAPSSIGARSFFPSPSAEGSSSCMLSATTTAGEANSEAQNSQLRNQKVSQAKNTYAVHTITNLTGIIGPSPTSSEFLSHSSTPEQGEQTTDPRALIPTTSTKIYTPSACATRNDSDARNAVRERSTRRVSKFVPKRHTRLKKQKEKTPLKLECTKDHVEPPE